MERCPEWCKLREKESVVVKVDTEKMKGVLFLISVLLLSVAIDAKSLASNFMKIKESIKSLKPGGKRGMAGMGQAGVPSQRALERCFRYGRRGRYSVPGVIYRRDPNPNVKGNYINVEKLGYDPARTKTIYRFNCRKPEFSSTGLCQQIAQEKDDRPTSRRRRLLAGSRREGQCRL
eukprot:g11655.t1